VRITIGRFYFDHIIADFEQALVQNPNSPDLHNHLAQTIVFREMYRNGALESEMVSGNNSLLRRPKLNPSDATRTRFLSEIDKSLSLCEARLKKNPNDPVALYAEGIAGIHAETPAVGHHVALFGDDGTDARLPEFGDNPVTQLSITNTNGVIALKLAVLSVPPACLPV